MLPNSSNTQLTIIADIDGCKLPSRERLRNGEQGYDELFVLIETLCKIQNQYGHFNFNLISDRPGAVILGIANCICPNTRFHIAESGGVIVDTLQHKVFINPAFEENAKQMTTIFQKFYEQFPNNNDHRLEPGSLCGLRIERYDSQENLEPFTVFLDKIVLNFPSFCWEDHGDCLILKPSHLTKRDGIKKLITLYTTIDTALDFTKTLGYGDGTSDIDFLSKIHQLGGFVGCVGNSSQALIKFIHGLHERKYVATQKYALGVVEILNEFLFSQNAIQLCRE